MREAISRMWWINSLHRSVLSSLLICFICLNQISHAVGYFQGPLGSVKVRNQLGLGSSRGWIEDRTHFSNIDDKRSIGRLKFETLMKRNDIDVMSLKRKFNAWGGKRSLQDGTHEMGGVFNSRAGKFKKN